jgi:peptidylprolyl isomerase/peptidyl-prolyl cis-trans isomerase B (cyclophilin B)
MEERERLTILCKPNKMKKRIFIFLIAIMAMTSAKSADSIPAGPVVDIRTSLGDIKVRLYDDTPKHRDNFLKLVREGFYDGVLFHRVIKDFMIQTGDPSSRTADSTAMLGAGDPGYTIEAEIAYPRHYHKRGALAAARTGDQVNPERRSSGSQFYIVTGEKVAAARMAQMAENAVMGKRQQYFRTLVERDREKISALEASGDRDGLEALRQSLIAETENAVKAEPLPDNIVNDYTTVGGTPHLDGQYTVFGEVISGMDTVEKIENVATGRADRPLEDVRIISATIEK